MAENLTPEQALAVTDRGGKLLVSAAAGSGKTKVLVDRLMGYLMDPVAPANIDDFLIITYTKAAASELRGKIAAKLSEHLAIQPDNRHLQRQMQRLYLAKISTVHSFCTDLIREYGYEMEFGGDFRVGEDNECCALREQVLADLLEEAYRNSREDADFRAFVDSQGLGRDDRLIPEIIQKVYDSARCHLDPASWLERCLRDANISESMDASQTKWGKFLMEDLFSGLKGHIRALELCAEKSGSITGMEKVSALLNATVEQLRFLADSTSWDQVVQRKQIDYGTLRFPKKTEDPILVERIKSVRESAKKDITKRLRAFSDPSDVVMEDLHQASAAARGLVQLVRGFDERYSRMKRRYRILDFSDLEHRTLDLLLGKRRNTPTQIAREVGRRFREVLVDEYQDSNAVQDAIFGALTEERQNCFMVGDVKQSIYQFRLADPGIFIEKYNTYLDADAAQPGQGRRILLSRNFRSGGAVLEAVNDVFRCCMSPDVGGLTYGQEEALREGVSHEPLGEPEVELHLISTQEDAYAQEAAFVAERICQLLDGKHMIRGKDGLRPIAEEDIVILLRSPGSAGQVFQAALTHRGIRCAFGGGKDLLQTAEISALLALLQVISNPHQDIPLIAALASPVFSFTADDLAKIRGRNKNIDLFDALRKDDSGKAKAFLEILEILRRQSKMGSVASVIEEIFLLTGMESIYTAMEGGVERQSNLRSFFELAVEFESSSRRDLDQFLEHVIALQRNGMTMKESGAAGAVTIMSIHKSKGLEFPVVFLSNLSRSFNTESFKAQVLCHKELGLGLSVMDHSTRVRYPTIGKRAITAKGMAEGISEELRVLYVAMTRARDRLIMTYAAKTMEKELEQLCSQVDICGNKMLAAGVSCPGEWILLEAISRIEAGSIFAVAGCRPDELHTGAYPWLIRVHDGFAGDAAQKVEQEQQLQQIPEDAVSRIRAGLEHQYLYEAATQMASKQTATQLKGRQKDQEAAQDTQPQTGLRTWRKPELTGNRANAGKAYGTSMHTVMQYIRFDRCTDDALLEEELQDLVARRLISAEQLQDVDRQGILAFFRTELGAQLLAGDQVLREFKFSILDDAERYGSDLSGEQVLLQGVVDCALVGEEITVVDFKTDRVTEETAPEVLERYRPQVEVYARALERIFRKKVSGKYIYFFRLRKLMDVF